MTNKKTNKQEHKMIIEDFEKDEQGSLEYTGDDYDGRDTYMQGDVDERDMNNSFEGRTCHRCGCEQGRPLESFEDGGDFEPTDDCGTPEEIDREKFRICEECFEASHDTHWHATHPEY